MAETLLSPGVLARENDQSFISQQPAEVGAAIIGPAELGPVEVPTLVTSFSEYTAVFGSTVQSGSRFYSYLTSLAANNYFQSGGNSLLVTRVVQESFSSATSSFVNSVDGEPLLTGTSNAAALTANITDGGTSFTGSGAGTDFKFEANYTASGAGSGATFSITSSNGVIVEATASAAGNHYKVGDTITFRNIDNGGAPIKTSTELSGSATFDSTDTYNAGTITI